MFAMVWILDQYAIVATTSLDRSIKMDFVGVFRVILNIRGFV